MNKYRSHNCNELRKKNVGSNILEEKLLSPFLSDISDFEVFVIGDKVYPFGKVKDLR